MDVSCIQAGQAVIAVRVTQGENELGDMALSTDLGSSSVNFDRYRLSLVQVEPDPVSSQTIDMSEYRETLLVTSN